MNQPDVTDIQGAARKRFAEARCCVIVPTYNNGGTLGQVLDGILAYTEQIIVVNDGSTDATREILRSYAGMEIVELPANRGKGIALRTGFQHAINAGFRYAITIDSDGQHSPADLPKFLAKLAEEPGVLVIGSRNMEQESVPGRSNFGRKFSNFWFRVETGLVLDDTQSGYRLYPLEAIRGMRLFTRKFELEIEVLVRAAWRGVRIVAVPVKVWYAPRNERVSHFRPGVDFARISVLNTILVTLALLYYRPRLWLRRITWHNLKALFVRKVLHSNDSNERLAMSVAVGLVTGILPIWGYQIAAALGLAILFRLNKTLTFIASNISLPPVIPLILYASLITGRMVLRTDTSAPVFSSSMDLAFVRTSLTEYLVGSTVLALATGVVGGAVAYGLLRLFRRGNRTSSGSGLPAGESPE